MVKNKINHEIENECKYIKSNMHNGYKLSLDKQFKFHVEDLIKESYEHMEYVGETIERKVKEELQHYNFGIKYTNFYAYLIREVMRNVVEHSDAEEFILSFYYNELGEFGFYVIDEGIGIKKSLNRNPNYSVTDNKTALAFAIRPGITRSWKRDPLRDDVWQNSGFGLYMVSNIVNIMGGRFEISSGNSKIIFRSGLKEYQSIKIKGTAVLVTFNTKIKIDTLKIINEVSKAGNEYVKSSFEFSNYAKIKTASKASTLI